MEKCEIKVVQFLPFKSQSLVKTNYREYLERIFDEKNQS